MKDLPRIQESLTANPLTFGIKFLDDALYGILPVDLVVIAAPSGIGKTDLAANILFKNAQNGRRAFGIFLEAFEGEIEMRQKFRLLARTYYNEQKALGKNVLQVYPKPVYVEWFLGHQQWLDKYTIKIDHFHNAFTKYRGKEYTAKDVKRDLLALNDDAELIVIDHLHYFDLDNENENKAITEIVKTIADTIQVIQKPVVLVSHIKKRDKKFSEAVPTIDDVFGTGSITKIATKVVTLAPYNIETEVADQYRWKTLMRPAKFRLNSAVANYVGLLTYNTSLGDYEKQYHVGKLVQEGRVFEETQESLFWKHDRGGKGDDKETAKKGHIQADARSGEVVEPTQGSLPSSDLDGGKGNE
jgi:KaiC/GvpD/RAD55 family RecA-like ATPase